ncbi:MAG: hypothetical protein HQK76_00525 [Desulfobacterales bacterium]|nr:hypothetical protein [Desulfobacterales bacterium]
MMPVYFPFTTISNYSLKLLLSAFKKVMVYQPSKNIPEPLLNLEKQGYLYLKIPFSGDEKQLDIAEKDFKFWLNSHKGTDTNLLKNIKNSQPFVGESSALSIKNLISHYDKKADKTQTATSEIALFYPRLFLKITQDFDINMDEINNKLILYNKMEQDIIHDITFEKDDLKTIPDLSLIPDNSKDFMIKERIEALSSLIMNDSDLSGIYITTSKNALEYILDKFPDAEKIFKITNLPVYTDTNDELISWQNSLHEYLEKVSNSEDIKSVKKFILQPPKSKAASNFSLTSYVIPNNNPYYVFEKFTPTRDKQPNNEKIRNTIICLLDLNKDSI